jgi:predicted phage tail protein
MTGAAATAPGVPLNLTTSSSGSSVALAWSAPASADATGYVIEAGSAPGLANLANFATGSTATRFSASGIGNGTYYVRVRAQNTAGTSATSNESALVVGSSACTSAPGAPSGLAITTSGSTVTLLWAAPAGGCAPTSYVLQAGSSAGTSNLANSNVGNTTSYVATGVGNGTYYVRVRAANAYGQSAGSNEFTLTVGSASPSPSPNPPAGTAPDVQPRIVSYGTVSGCSGGTLTSTFTVSAPANLTWTVSISGWPDEVATPMSGSGSGTVTLAINNLPANYRCRDGQAFPSQGGMTIFFSSGAYISPSVRYSTALAVFY